MVAEAETEREDIQSILAAMNDVLASRDAQQVSAFMKGRLTDLNGGAPRRAVLPSVVDACNCALKGAWADADGLGGKAHKMFNQYFAPP